MARGKKQAIATATIFETVAARDGFPVVHDQNVVAQLFRLGQHLRRQHDRPAATSLATEAVHERALEDRIQFLSQIRRAPPRVSRP
jgi:hypothetical protein